MTDGSPTFDVSHPELRALFTLWNDLRADRALPDRKDFDPFVLKRWLGHVMLVEVTDGGADFRYRLYGSELVEIFGFDLTGRLVGACRDLIGDKPHDEYKWSHEHARPLGISRSSPSNEKLVEMDKIVLPLSNGGTEVGMILSAIYRSSSGS
jgi:hypothetical protein